MVGKCIEIVKRSLVLLLASGSLLLFSPMMVAHAQVDAKTEACTGVGAVSGTTGCAGDGLTGLIGKVISLFSVVIGVAAVIAVLYGAFRYITSAGDAQKVNTAKNTIIYALIGIVVAVSAQIIVRFVAGKAGS